MAVVSYPEAMAEERDGNGADRENRALLAIAKQFRDAASSAGRPDVVAKIDEFQVPASPKTTFNVGRVGGGTSVNAIPFEAWMEVDMRSSDPASLKALDTRFQAALHQAVDEENRRWNNRARQHRAERHVGCR